MGCSGGYLDNVWQYLEDKGVVGETCYPYVSGTTGSETPCSSTCTASSPSSQKYKSLACYKLSGVRTIQADILLYGPVMGTFVQYISLNISFVLLFFSKSLLFVLFI
jgi:hypothetical protein